jgi:hypothetical protein
MALPFLLKSHSCKKHPNSILYTYPFSVHRGATVLDCAVDRMQQGVTPCMVLPLVSKMSPFYPKKPEVTIPRVFYSTHFSSPPFCRGFPIDYPIVFLVA